jgi:hypothetical protein
MHQRTGRAALDAWDAAAYGREFGDATFMREKKQRRHRARLAVKAAITAWRARRARA